MPAVIKRPETSEYGEYFHGYVEKVKSENALDELTTQIAELRGMLEPASETDCSTVHEPYTWTLKQVIGHCIDSERVFGYRASRIATGDQTELPGFDQDQFVASMDYENVTMAALLDELEQLRVSNVALYKRFSEDQLKQTGTASGLPISVRALGFLLAGHVRHHLDIIQTRLNG